STRASRVVLLLEDGQRWAELPPAVAANSASGLAHVGVGGACHVAGDYPRSYREAERALRLADLADGPRLSVYEELGVYQLFADLREPEALGSFVERWIGPLLAYDTAHGADLVHTLTEYLEAGGNYDHTAAALILHRSTLRYRLRRIREITGLDLNDPDTRFNLQLATRARHSLERIGGNAPVIG
ncbi:MAG TPA: helix-turn-helix domain-containing protein, partial [Acidimicrobiales bacterium]|nr:helix-turn-helix domain-containing protein [Acidimicrobiales bacterium]